MAALILINTFSEKNVKFFPKSAPRVGRERKNKLVISAALTFINLNKSEGKYSPNLPMNIQLLIGAVIIFLLNSIGG